MERMPVPQPQSSTRLVAGWASMSAPITISEISVPASYIAGQQASAKAGGLVGACAECLASLDGNGHLVGSDVGALGAACIVDHYARGDVYGFKSLLLPLFVPVAVLGR